MSVSNCLLNTAIEEHNQTDSFITNAVARPKKNRRRMEQTCPWKALLQYPELVIKAAC